MVEGEQPMQVVGHRYPGVGLAAALQIAAAYLPADDLGQRGIPEQGLPVVRDHGDGIDGALHGVAAFSELWAGHGGTVSTSGDGVYQ